MINSMTYTAGSPEANLSPLFTLDHLKPVTLKLINPDGYMVTLTATNPVQAGNVIGWFESHWSGEEITIATSQDED